MDQDKSLDKYKLIAALLHDAHASHGAVFNCRALRLTLKQVSRRSLSEGARYFTVALPRLGKALDKALAGEEMIDCGKLRLAALPNTKLPRFLGEFFSQVFSSDGTVLPNPCVDIIRVLRQLLLCFYKYEEPYTDEQCQRVVSKFERTEDDIKTSSEELDILYQAFSSPCYPSTRRCPKQAVSKEEIARKARHLLSDLFAFFDPMDIYPRHGPGVVATKQRLWEKFRWTNISRNITEVYPLDAFFYASLGHFCDSYKELSKITDEDLPAKVILVPKDSRGPRLISCEPVDYQWIQQGLGRAIVRHAERSELTKFNVFFTNQQPNRFGALLGSSTGKYVTLDLNEASDRVSVSLVRLLFPDHLYKCLAACRSSSTVLPSGKVLPLRKFAPMGSSLCFPVMALTIWAILTAAAPDEDVASHILVYGDDVIVPTAFAERAMEQLESFGLKINRDKSCIKGSFRESCGMDAYQGSDVTPIKFRSVWSSLRCPDSYTSWIAYANSLVSQVNPTWSRKYHHTYDYIVGRLTAVYGDIPTRDMHLACPSLVRVPETRRPIRHRVNRSLQKLQYRVWDVKSPNINHDITGWEMLLRYFSEAANTLNLSQRERQQNTVFDCFPHVREKLPVSEDYGRCAVYEARLSEFMLFHGHGSWERYPILETTPFSVSQYTRPRTSMLVRRWR